MPTTRKLKPGFMVSNTAECCHVEEHSDEKYLNHSDWFSLRSKTTKWQLSSFLPVHRGCFPDVDTVDNSERPFIRGALHALFPPHLPPARPTGHLLLLACQSRFRYRYSWWNAMKILALSFVLLLAHWIYRPPLLMILKAWRKRTMGKGRDKGGISGWPVRSEN